MRTVCRDVQPLESGTLAARMQPYPVEMPAGSGKSSLLGAMVGLMQQVAGTPDALRGKIAYVPQVLMS